MCSHDTTAIGLSDRHNKVVLSSDGRIALSADCLTLTRLPAIMLLMMFLSPFTNPIATEPLVSHDD